MTNQRCKVKEAHERSTVGLFLDNFNHCYHADFKVVSEPNPPEGIIKSRKSVSWIEVTTAFLTREHAIDLNSYVTEGEIHKPRSGGVCVEPDVKFVSEFVKVVRQKLEKQTYVPIREKYGLGYLIVSIQNPLYGQDTLRLMQRKWSDIIVDDKKCFKSIYIVSGNKVSLWRPALART